MYFKDLLRYRNAWLGFAMLWIILFHLPFSFADKSFTFIKSIGYGGVDICMFASGIGCYYSLASKSDVGFFMKKRLNRIMPTYILFMVFWLIYQITLGTFKLPMAIGNIFAVQQLTGQGSAFNWYISAILLFYFFAPYFKSLVDRASNLTNALFLIFLIVITVPFWKSHNMIIVVTRLAIFYIGMLIAKACKAGAKLSTKHIVISALMLISGYLLIRYFFGNFVDYKWSHGLYWYPFILITPPLCLAISLLMMLFEKTRVTKTVLSFLSLCGAYSFEIYLVHIPLVAIIPTVIKKYNITDKAYLLWLSGVVVLISGCFILRRTVTLYEKIKKQKSKKSVEEKIRN